jgi:hypothetical protein
VERREEGRGGRERGEGGREGEGTKMEYTYYKHISYKVIK